jgi:hypothetical protein
MRYSDLLAKSDYDVKIDDGIAMPLVNLSSSNGG